MIFILYKQTFWNLKTINTFQDLLSKINVNQQLSGRFKYTIHTRIGEGPKLLKDDKSHLLNNRGLPVKDSKSE